MTWNMRHLSVTILACQRSAHHCESIAFARLPSTRDYIVGHARSFRYLTAIASKCRPALNEKIIAKDL
jgi:hypothetical protein